MSDSVVVTVTVTAPKAHHPSAPSSNTPSVGRPGHPAGHQGSLPYTGFSAIEAVLVGAAAVLAGFRLALVRRTSRRIR